MQQWFGKAHGQTLRIAGILSLLDDPAATTINIDHMTAAEGWIDYFTEHTQAISITSGSSDCTVFHARRVIDWLRRQALPNMSRSVISQALRCHDLPAAKDWDVIFDLLCQRGYLRERRINGGAGGGRPSTGFDINPELLTPMV
jgi:hypothetical protein